MGEYGGKVPGNGLEAAGGRHVQPDGRLQADGVPGPLIGSSRAERTEGRSPPGEFELNSVLTLAVGHVVGFEPRVSPGRRAGGEPWPSLRRPGRRAANDRQVVRHQLPVASEGAGSVPLGKSSHWKAPRLSARLLIANATASAVSRAERKSR